MIINGPELNKKRRNERLQLLQKQKYKSAFHRSQLETLFSILMGTFWLIAGNEEEPAEVIAKLASMFPTVLIVKLLICICLRVDLIVVTAAPAIALISS